MKQNENRKMRGGEPRRHPGSSIMPERISLGHHAIPVITPKKETSLNYTQDPSETYSENCLISLAIHRVAVDAIKCQ